MKKHLRMKASMLMVFVLVLLSISGCVTTNVPSVSFTIENSNHLVSVTDQIYVRYADGSSSLTAVYDSTNADGEVYKAATDSAKTIVGGYVSNGMVSWVPTYQADWFNSVSYKTYDPATWGKPTTPVSYATVNNAVYNSDDHYMEVTFDVYGAQNQKVDGRTEVFIQSGDNSVDFGETTSEATAKGISSFTENGTVTFKIFASTDNLSSLQLSLKSGPNAFPIHLPDVDVASIGVSSNSSTLDIGDTLQMSADISPAYASNRNVVWSVAAGTGTAAINTTGLLTGNTAGTVTVKATAADGSGVFGIKLITVNPILVNSLTLSGASSVTVGGTVQYTETAAPSNASDKSVTWSVVDGTGSATINSSGLLTATSVGTVTVNAISADASHTLGTANLTINAVSISTPAPSSIPAASSSPTPTPVPTASPISTPAPTTAPTPSIFINTVVDNIKEIKTIQLLVENANNSTDHVELTDVRGHWAEQTVDTFIKLGVIQGYGDHQFHPDGDITRAEFATIITKVFSMEAGTKSVKLADLNTHWAKAAIEKLASLGVLGGYGDGTFRPDRTITREEMIIIVSRVVNLTAAPKGMNTAAFTDINGSYAKDALNNAVNAGILSGKGGNKMEPKSKATRAEALTIVLNTLNLNPQIKTLLDELK